MDSDYDLIVWLLLFILTSLTAGIFLIHSDIRENTEAVDDNTKWHEENYEGEQQ